MPYAGARVVSEATHVVHEDGVLVVGEVVAPGRAARGERLRYESVESILEVRRPDGRLLVRDRLELRPEEGRLHFGLMGSYEALGTLFVIRKGFDWRGLEAELDTGCTHTAAGANSPPAPAPGSRCWRGTADQLRPPCGRPGRPRAAGCWEPARHRPGGIDQNCH
ncbi:MAG TPA: urease accessory protein UreD [Candidatus Dormibacteraeota bacterium]